jgi:hypothetical protein
VKKRRAKPVEAGDRASGLVLDAGALQALERRSIRLLANLSWQAS